MSNLVASSTFQDAWVAANREAHASLVSALTGEDTGRRRLGLAGPGVGQPRRRSSRRSSRSSSRGGCPSPTGSPPSTPSSSCCRATTSARPRRRCGCSTSRGCVLPVLAILALRRRCRARSVPPAGAASSAPRWWSARSCCCCSASSCCARSTSTTSSRCCSCRRWATVLFDTVTTPLRLAVRSTAVLFLVIALAAWIAGPVERRGRPCGRCPVGCPG